MGSDLDDSGRDGAKLEVSNLYFWRYFSDRIESLKEKLWTQVTWLVGLIGALIAYMTEREVISWNADGPPLAKPLPALLLGLVGLVLSLLGVILIWEAGKHIGRNQWRQSHFAKDIPVLRQALELENVERIADAKRPYSGFKSLPAFCKLLLAIVIGLGLIFLLCIIVSLKQLPRI